MSEYKKIDTYLEKNLDKSIDELGKLVAQPSISAQGIGLKECASLSSATWTAVGQAPTVQGWRRTVRLPLTTASNHFFRLEAQP